MDLKLEVVKLQYSLETVDGIISALENGIISFDEGQKFMKDLLDSVIVQCVGKESQELAATFLFSSLSIHSGNRAGGVKTIINMLEKKIITFSGCRERMLGLIGGFLKKFVEIKQRTSVIKALFNEHVFDF